MRILFTTVIAATLMATPAIAADKHQDPHDKADESWISIDGTVKSVRSDAFTLDYGPGEITVEMDDGDRDADGYKLVKDDRVRVSGRVDNDLFQKTTIEAGSVYVENLGTYFYASTADEEDTFVTYWYPIDVSKTVLQGKVTNVDKLENEFIIDTGNRAVRVDTDSMPYDPLDDTGYQKIESGDRVSVTGEMDTDFFEAGRELEADSILTLSD